eukprot:3968240-Amphidinium_carterae.1
MSHREATLSQHEYFAHIPQEVINGEWSVVSSNRWHRSEHIVVLEGRSLIHALKHLLRGKTALDHNHVFLTDSLVCAGCLSKGRSSSSGLCRVSRQWCALQLASGVNVSLRWLPSEQNPADIPSRQHMFCGSVINWSWEEHVSETVDAAGEKRDCCAWESGSTASQWPDAEDGDCEGEAGLQSEREEETQGEHSSCRGCHGRGDSADGGVSECENTEHVQGHGEAASGFCFAEARGGQRTDLGSLGSGVDEQGVSRWGSLVKRLLHDSHGE